MSLPRLDPVFAQEAEERVEVRVEEEVLCTTTACSTGATLEVVEIEEDDEEEKMASEVLDDGGSGRLGQDAI